MRIGLDGRFYRSGTGGIGRYTRELVKHLLDIDRENQYILFLTADDRDECTLHAQNLTKRVIPIPHFSIAEQMALPSLLKKERLDVTHFLNFNHPLFYSGRYLTTIHDLTMNFFPVGRQKLPILRQAYLLTMQHAATGSSAVIVPTETVKRDVIKYLHASPEKIEVIYEGVEMPACAIARPQKNYLKTVGITKPYLLFVSQWRPHKGLEVLLNAFEIVKKQHDVQLVITGKPNDQFPEIPAAIQASPNRNDIITPGFVDDELLDALYAGAELFVFPSWYEGFGLPPLEAMARGVVVASSNTSVMPEILGQAAAYFDPYQPKDIARSIDQVLSDRTLQHELKRKGLAQAARYSWRTMAKETLALYRRIYETK